MTAFCWKLEFAGGGNVSCMEISPWLRVYKVDWLTRVVVFRALPLKWLSHWGPANTRVRWEEDALHSGEFLNIYSTSLSCISILFSSQKGFLLDLGLTVQTNSRSGRSFRVSKVSVGNQNRGLCVSVFCPCPKNLHKAEFKRGSFFVGENFKTVNNVESIKCLCSFIEFLCNSTKKSKWD